MIKAVYPINFKSVQVEVNNEPQPIIEGNYVGIFPSFHSADLVVQPVYLESDQNRQIWLPR